MNDMPGNPVESAKDAAQPRLKFTLVSGALIVGVYLLLQFAATNAAATLLGLTPSQHMGDLIALGVLSSSIPCTLLVLRVVSRTPGIGPRTWLALHPVRSRTLFGWVVSAFVLLQLADLVTVELGRAPVPPVIETIAETTRYPALLWFALVITAPVFEEALFRGFLHEGLRRTRIGGGGTILVTTVVWTLLHTALYDVYFLTLVGLIGILLGVARERTGSLYIPLAIHAMNNLLGGLQMATGGNALIQLAR